MAKKIKDSEDNIESTTSEQQVEQPIEDQPKQVKETPIAEQRPPQPKPEEKRNLAASAPFLVSTKLAKDFTFWFDNYKLSSEATLYKDYVGLDADKFLRIPKIMQVIVFTEFLRTIWKECSFVPHTIGYLPNKASHTVSIPTPLHDPGTQGSFYVDYTSCAVRTIELGLSFVEKLIENNGQLFNTSQK